MNREEVVLFLKQLREEIIQAFEAYEKGKNAFQRKPWQHHTGGGGEIALLRGTVFEKAAVNWSGVSGSQFPMQDSSGPFFATGISLITHMCNPHAPTVHMNLRYIETETKRWFGGGYDLTPMGFPYAEDTEHFHNAAKQALSPFGPSLYDQFSRNAAEYFYIPHWKRERGVGGIFFDHYWTGDEEQDFALWQSLGKSFLKSILPIYERRTCQIYSDQEKNEQLWQRGKYAEFNLAYDRGTKFGFASGGNPEAILCSMPPLVRW